MRVVVDVSERLIDGICTSGFSIELIEYRRYGCRVV